MATDTTQLEITGSIDASRTTSPQKVQEFIPRDYCFCFKNLRHGFGHLSGY